MRLKDKWSLMVRIMGKTKNPSSDPDDPMKDVKAKLKEHSDDLDNLWSAHDELTDATTESIESICRAITKLNGLIEDHLTPKKASRQGGRNAKPKAKPRKRGKK